MGLVSGIAMFFIIWWLMLFIVLPLGVRSQLEDDNVTLGTEHGAPSRPFLWRKLALTTALTAVAFGILYAVIVVGGLTLDDIPRIVPRYQRPLE